MRYNIRDIDVLRAGIDQCAQRERFARVCEIRQFELGDNASPVGVVLISFMVRQLAIISTGPTRLKIHAVTGLVHSMLAVLPCVAMASVLTASSTIGMYVPRGRNQLHTNF